MNLNDLNHASLTSCDQDASSALLCRYRLIRAARNCHHGGIVTTEPDRPRAGPLRLAGWLLAQASACPPSESFRFWWLSRRECTASGRVRLFGARTPRRSGAPPSAQSCAAGAHVCALKSLICILNLIKDPIQIIWNCVVKVP